ncbi:UV DNA damage repair endonuclease UvsE [bacterium]|nr:UV DNA damage repair endonuclease UvsE [bacterium]NDD84101.1 UV DNA damage repair endonuclease UvsE [bacterium]NDG31572.1 UV DNA damage repair endonuclease UvsE [bacterium]
MSCQLVLGYCCLNTELRQLGIFSSRTLRLNTLKTKGMHYAYQLALQNVRDTFAIFKWNAKHGIYNFRISSELFAFASHPEYHNTYDWEQFYDILLQLGKCAKQYHQYITFHPGQYNQLTSTRESVIEQTVVDVNVHAKILDLMQLDDSVIVIHGGARGSSKLDSLKRFRQNYKLLSPSAQRRLVLENDEIVYTVEDLLPVSRDLGIPIVFDTHHHNLNPGTLESHVAAQMCADTFTARGLVPLMHISESRPGVTSSDSVTVRRAHSNYVTEVPRWMYKLQVPKVYVDIEAKMKEQAVLQLLEK